jgi:hypothetical protein
MAVTRSRAMRHELHVEERTSVRAGCAFVIRGATDARMLATAKDARIPRVHLPGTIKPRTPPISLGPCHTRDFMTVAAVKSRVAITSNGSHVSARLQANRQMVEQRDKCNCYDVGRAVNLSVETRQATDRGRRSHACLARHVVCNHLSPLTQARSRQGTLRREVEVRVNENDHRSLKRRTLG